MKPKVLCIISILYYIILSPNLKRKMKGDGVEGRQVSECEVALNDNEGIYILHAL